MIKLTVDADDKTIIIDCKQKTQDRAVLVVDCKRKKEKVSK